MRVLGLGTVLVDQQVLLPRYPDVDTKNEMSSHRLQVGGPVPTALAQLSRFGHGCEFIGRWGNDTFGRLIQTDLTDASVDYQGSQIIEGGDSGFAHVWIDQSNGDRTVAFTRGTCGPIESAPLRHCMAETFDLIHVDGWSAPAAYDLARRLHDSGGLVTIDSGSPKPGMEQLFPLADLINCPARFAQQYFGDADTDVAAQRLLKLGAKRVVFTHGVEGAVLYVRDERIYQPAFAIDPIDTNGAGDVFCGGLMSRYNCCV